MYSPYHRNDTLCKDPRYRLSDAPLRCEAVENAIFYLNAL